MSEDLESRVKKLEETAECFAAELDDCRGRVRSLAIMLIELEGKSEIDPPAPGTVEYVKRQILLEAKKKRL
jgi:hypothetical protein